MGLCSSKIEPNVSKSKKHRSTDEVHTNLDNLSDAVVDINNTEDASVRATLKDVEDKNKATPIYANNENNSSTDNNDIKKSSSLISKVDSGIGKRSKPSSYENNIETPIPAENSSQMKKYIISNPNVKLSTSKLIKDDMINQNVNKSSLSMSNTMDMSGVYSPLADLQDTPQKEDTYKVLLLGVGESGKSTVLKQFKILRQGGYTQDELEKLRSVIYKNLLDIVTDICKARNKYKIPVGEADIKDLKGTIKDVDDFMNTLRLSIDNRNEFITRNVPLEELEIEDIVGLPSKFFAYLAILWKTPATQALLRSKHRKNFHLLGNASYFIDSLERISKPDYVPTVDDVLKARIQTSGIQETTVEMQEDNIKLKIYDVGGQRVERKKWIQCFSNVSILIFCVSLSDYDSPLEEDPKINALAESIQLFDSIVNSKWFVNTQVMLFLNKIDIFIKKIKQSPLNTYFPEYSGDPKDAKASVKYILSLLKARNRANLTIYPHVTQATDSSNIELVFATLAETVLENKIKNLGAI
ncbi:hypothetical protein ACO0R3_000255 [Hanseniaspora guilliermondii]